MNWSVSFKNLPWKANKANPQDRFVNLDGSRYGSGRLSRLLTAPYVQGWIASNLLASAAEVCLLPQRMQDPHALLRFIELNAVGIPVLFGFRSVMFNESLPISSGAAIDTLGHLPSDPIASIKMRRHYKLTGVLSAIIPLGFTALTTAMGLPLPASELLIGFPVAAATLPLGIWSFHASRKLGRGDWTIHTNPPPIEAKAPQMTSGQVLAANVRQRSRDCTLT